MAYQQMQAKVTTEENQSSIKLATKAVIHKISKHIDKKHHFLCDNVDDIGSVRQLVNWRHICSKVISPDERRATWEAIFGSDADSSSIFRNKVSGGVKQKVIPKFLQLPTLFVFTTVAQYSEKTNVICY